MRHLAVFVAVVGFCLSDAMPFNDCRDHYEYCGKWARYQYCELNDYKDYMNLVCPYSCGLCDDILTSLSASGQAASDTGSSTGSQDTAQKVIPEVDADFENFEDMGSASQQSDVKADQKDESQSLSGSGEEQDGPLFRATETNEAESRFHGEAKQQNESGDQQESISGSGGDPTGANFWAVVRVEPDAANGGSERELHLSRRSEKSTPGETTREADGESASGAETSGEYVSQKSELPVKSSSGEEVTSGDKTSQRGELPVISSSGQDVTSGEDDTVFDTSSTESELDSGCSSGDGCYDSEGVQGGEGGDSNSRSVIARAEEDAVASGSAATSDDSSSNVWLHPHFDVLAGPYDDKASGSGAVPLGSGSVSELGNALHDIEDAIFETGIPLQITQDTVSGSGLPSPAHSESQDDSQTSGSGTGGAEREEDARLFLAPQHHEKINLMEKMLKLGKLHAFKISHIATVGGSSRNKVPRIDEDIDDDDDADADKDNIDDNAAIQSDLGKGKKVSFVLNQDFHDGYGNENSSAYNILANNVKNEVEKALGSNAVVSEISFSEVREPVQSPWPRFSKVMTSFKLLGDVTKLEEEVKKGAVNNLVVDNKFFHAS